MSRRGLLLLAAALGAALAIAFALTERPGRALVETSPVVRQALFRSTVTASGEIVASRYADIGSSVMGKIVSLPVAEGDRVRAGQLLARIDPVQAEGEAAGAREQRRALESEALAAREQLKSANATVAAAEARAGDARQVLARRRQLSADQLVPTSDVDTAQADADAAAAELAGARAAADRAEQALEAASRRTAQARAQETQAADLLAKTAVASPIDGTVTRLRVRTGEMVVIGVQNQPGTTLMTISDLGVIDAEVKVAEADVLSVKTGQPARITLEALPARPFTGRVVEIGASALPVSGTGAAAREFRVVVRLDDPAPGLRPGLTCDAEIVTSERADVLTVPLQSVVLRTIDGVSRTGVFVVTDGAARFVPVTSGVIGGLSIEVDGVGEGALVVTGPYQLLRELQDGTLVAPAAGR